jgi:Holliday junction resolvase RusA-like endonuclease
MQAPIYKFTIDRLPPSVNHLYRTTYRHGGRPLFYKEPKVKEFEKIAGLQLKKVKKSFTGAMSLGAIFTFKSPKRFATRDLDNLLKLVGDALEANLIIENDNLIAEINCEKRIGASDSIEGTLWTI